MPVINILSDFIQNNWTNTYPVQIVEVEDISWFRFVLQLFIVNSHNFVLTHGSGKAETLMAPNDRERTGKEEALIERKNFFRSLAKGNVSLIDTWMRPEGICRTYKELTVTKIKLDKMSWSTRIGIDQV